MFNPCFNTARTVFISRGLHLPSKRFRHRRFLLLIVNPQSTFIHRSYVHAALAPYREQFVATYGRSIMQVILSGLAGQAPRSVTQNLIEMLSTLLTRCMEESKVWLREVLFDVCSSYYILEFHSLILDAGELYAF